METFCQRCFSLLRSLVFPVKDTFTKGFTNADPAFELKYNDPIFIQKTRIIAAMTV